VELEHLKIKTTLIDEMFASVMGEYVFVGLRTRIGGLLGSFLGEEKRKRKREIDY
jgi:hypothetical protein